MAVDPIILEFRAETARLKKQIDGLDKGVNTLKKDSKSATDTMDKGFKKTEGAVKKTDKQVSGLNKTFNTLATRLVAAFAVERIIRFTAEAVKLAETAKGVETAFKNIAGANLDSLRRATRGTVSDLQLMQNAVQAQKLGLPIEELGNLFAFATQRARETGISVDFLTNSIVTGIGGKSPLILDNLGISAVALKEALGGVSTEAATVAQVTAAVSKIIEGEMANAIDSGVSGSQQMAAAIENLSLAIGKRLLPSVEDASKGLAELVQNYSDGIEEVALLNETLDRGFLRQIFDFPAEMLLGIRDELIKTQRGAQLFAQSASEAAAAGRWSDAADDIAYLRERLDSLEEGTDEYKIVLSALTTAQDAYNEALMAQIGIGLEVNDDDTERIGIIKALKDQLKSLNDEIDNATSQNQINAILDRRIELETQINAILNQRQNLQDNGVDPELEAPTFANTPFDTSEIDAEREQDVDDFYEMLLQKKIETDEKEIESERRKAALISETYQNRLNAAVGFFGALDELLLASGKNSKELAVFNAFLNLYQSISAALAQPLDPITKAIYVASMTAQAAAQIANIQKQQVPSFYEGTDFVSDSPSKGRRRDDVAARLHYGEAVITADANKRNKGLSSALNKGRENNWIHSHHVLPALMAQKKEFEKQQKKDFATAITQSLALNMPDERIVREVKRGRIVQQAILEAYKSTGKRNPFRA